MKNWVKGEILEIEAIMEAISMKEAMVSRKDKSASKKKHNQKDLEKISQGQFTMKGLFKNKEAKANTQQQLLSEISMAEIDIVNYDILRNFLVIYLAEIAIPSFKVVKMNGYFNSMTNFCLEEISNAQKHQDTWSDFIEVVKGAQKNSKNLKRMM